MAESVCKTLGAARSRAYMIRIMAFDSRFRQLCSEQTLATPQGRQVLAPFAFVSAWAGLLMAIEMLRSFDATAATNYCPLTRGTCRSPAGGCCGRATLIASSAQVRIRAGHPNALGLAAVAAPTYSSARDDSRAGSPPMHATRQRSTTRWWTGLS